jgi:hypothetical protein
MKLRAKENLPEAVRKKNRRIEGCSQLKDMIFNPENN